jgi:hypothetical protein
MVNWQGHCSCRRASRPEARRPYALAVLLTAGLGAACGHAADQPAPDPTPTSGAAANRSLCLPADSGSLRGRLQGAIEVELDWGDGEPHCLGGVRPEGDGLRLVYRGSVPGTGELLILLGAGPLRPGESARNVPVNFTLVREGTGEFFATQGDDKCAFDDVQQAPLDAAAHSFRLEARGYCTQPARAVGGDGGSVLFTRFDVTAIVAAPPPDAPRPAAAGEP